MTNNENVENYLKKIYYDTKHPSSYGSIDSLYKFAKFKYPNLTKKKILEFLSEQYTYTLHRNARKNFVRNKIYVTHIDEQWEADIVDMQEFSRQNNNFKFILTVIDVLSKYLWAIPLKNKSALSVTSAVKKIFVERKPLKIRTDRGKEFDNILFKNLCRKNNIIFFTSKDKKIKCSIVERVNRTLKAKMFRYFTANGTRKYIDILQNLVDSYNNKIHRSIKMKPSEVNESSEYIAYENLYGKNKLRNIYFKLNKKKLHYPIGSSVRRIYDLSDLDKKYYPNWTDNTFKVVKVLKKPQKPQYIIQDYDKNELKRRFYEEELQKISPNTEYRIEKIIRKRKVGNKIEFLVKWIGYPSKYNSWISGKSLTSMTKRK